MADPGRQVHSQEAVRPFAFCYVFVRCIVYLPDRRQGKLFVRYGEAMS